MATKDFFHYFGIMKGICKTIHATPGQENHFDLELEDGHRFGFIPEVITSDSIDGELNALCGGRRKIQLI